MTGCHFDGLFPIKSPWLILQLFALQVRKQNGENVQRESKSGVPLVSKVKLSVVTPAGFSGQCQICLQHLQLSLHSWCWRPAALIPFFHWGQKHSFPLKMKPMCFKLETKTRDYPLHFQLLRLYWCD